MDRNIKLVLKIDGIEVERIAIVSILYQMEDDNEWNNPHLLTIGNVELVLEREKD